MDASTTIIVIDRLISGVTLLLNAIGASATVSATIAKRIAEGRDWTEEERQAVRDELAANKAYAESELAKPDGTVAAHTVAPAGGIAKA